MAGLGTSGAVAGVGRLAGLADPGGARFRQDAFGNGTVRWFGGANSGLETAVARSEGRRLVLGAPPAFDVAADTLVELVEGCDKSFATCRDRFGNAANFRGEPHLPGLDLITRWPGG